MAGIERRTQLFWHTYLCVRGAYSQIAYGKLYSATFQQSNLVVYGYCLGLGFWVVFTLTVSLTIPIIHNPNLTLTLTPY